MTRALTHSAPCPPLLTGIARELALMVPMVEDLSGLVKDHAIGADARDRPRILAQAQSVDDLTQRLQALIGVARAVAAGAGPASALEAVSLSDMQRRLQGALASADEPAPSTGAPSGDLMLFDQS